MPTASSFFANSIESDGILTMPLERAQAIVAQSHRAGKPVFAHVSNNQGIEIALAGPHHSDRRSLESAVCGAPEGRPQSAPHDSRREAHLLGRSETPQKTRRNEVFLSLSE